MAQAAGHRDRWQPLKNYCLGLLLPGERKSVEPMAARLAPNNVRRMHQSLHHVVADAPWSDRDILNEVWRRVLPAMRKQSPLAAWVVDDTGFPKKGKHSVGVARQYCGQLGKQDNCRVAVSLSITTAKASLPVAYDLYLPENWALDTARRKQAGVPDEIEFRTKPLIAIEQVHAAMQAGLPPAPVLADAAYGNDGKFREALDSLGLEYLVGIQSTLFLWGPDKAPLPAEDRKVTGRPPKLLRRTPENRPETAAELAFGLAANHWKKITWRQGTKQKLCSRFAGLRVRPAHRDYWRSEPWPEQWLLIEWPEGEAAPTKYWLGTVSAQLKLPDLVSLAKQRWIIERD